ncbi:uncharacterized protein LOC132720415 [Ruditapes philippinarum]|uniref:uncharacterized protein LOC132720415 n=1 Tax=Ruditapes philippinarum TaxID=129788 RepID=UPI00295BDEB8|nr:uncharacterized protein LOC132720415 [Ruditapes philippinarum]
MRIVIVEYSFVFGPLKMDFKQLLQTFLIIYTVKRCNGTIRINGTDGSTVKPSTTVKTFVPGRSTDSVVVVGVIIGLGLIFLLFISCMLFFIARRKIRSEEMEEGSRESDQLPSQHKNTTNRTLTHLYNRMRANRPLPSIPSSFRNIHPFKSRQQNLSGMYASIKSIKSNNSNARQVLDRQLSESSDCSYLEPIRITSISETVNIKPKDLNISKVTDVSPFETTKERLEMKMKSSSQRSANDMYIHPQYEAEMESKQNSIGERDANDRKQSKQMNVNHRDVHAIREDSLDQGTPGGAINDTEIIICCPGYMRLGSNSCEETDQDKNEKENIDNINNSKNTLIETDSSGYMPMRAVCKIDKKPVLEQNDSIFPHLIGFTSYFDADINEGMDKESQNEEKHIVKTKRYVKDMK